MTASNNFSFEYKPFSIDMGNLDKLCSLVINNHDREHVELEMKDSKTKFYSTEKKFQLDQEMVELLQKNGVSVMNSLYSTGDELAPWLYFFVVNDLVNNVTRLVVYYVKTIKDNFEVILDSYERKLTYSETIAILVKINCT